MIRQVRFFYIYLIGSRLTNILPQVALFSTYNLYVYNSSGQKASAYVIHNRKLTKHITCNWLNYQGHIRA